VDAGAVIGERVELSDRVWVGAGSYVGDDTAIGSDTRLFPSVTVYHDCRIGEDAFRQMNDPVQVEGQRAT